MKSFRPAAALFLLPALFPEAGAMASSSMPRIDIVAAERGPSCGGRGFAAPAMRDTLEPAPLSRGDRVEISIGGDRVFSGVYQINETGALKLPQLNPVPAHGRSAALIASELSLRLKAEGFYGVAPKVALRVVAFAPAGVTVGGAVSEPGEYNVGAGGVDGRGRTLAAALRLAGGARADANLSRIAILRGGVSFIVDLRPGSGGEALRDVALISGDAIEVPSLACVLESLSIPSAMAPQRQMVRAAHRAETPGPAPQMSKIEIACAAAGEVGAPLALLAR